jgi:hypothetical protein
MQFESFYADKAARVFGASEIRGRKGRACDTRTARRIGQHCRGSETLYMPDKVLAIITISKHGGGHVDTDTASWRNHQDRS